MFRVTFVLDDLPSRCISLDMPNDGRLYLHGSDRALRQFAEAIIAQADRLLVREKEEKTG